jgi:hypothetical protein
VILLLRFFVFPFFILCLTTGEISVFMGYRSLNFDAPKSNQARLERRCANGCRVDCEIRRLLKREVASVSRRVWFDLTRDREKSVVPAEKEVNKFTKA